MPRRQLLAADDIAASEAARLASAPTTLLDTAAHALQSRQADLLIAARMGCHTLSMLPACQIDLYKYIRAAMGCMHQAQHLPRNRSLFAFH